MATAPAGQGRPPLPNDQMQPGTVEEHEMEQQQETFEGNMQQDQ